MTNMLTLVLALSQLCTATPIPAKPDGYVYKRSTGVGGGDVTQLEAFFDLTCPDCKAAYPSIKEVAEYYGPEKLSLRVHLLPLPYHRQAFLAAQAGTALAAEKGESMFFRWVETMFENQSMFYNANSVNMTMTDAINAYSLLASQKLGVDVQQMSKWLGLTSQYNEDTRVSWKYSAFRGVTGTPGFLVNGVAVAADPSWTLQQWRQVLDPLVNPTKTTSNALGFGSCPPDTVECTYLPGKTACCTSGEMCITNVGCRC